MRTIDFSGKSIVVTGAGGGIGRASAELFASLGASVVVNDINGDEAEKTVQNIAAEGGKATLFAADITDVTKVDQMVAMACETYGKLDVMFNNAGGSFPTPMLDIDLDEFRRLMALNFDAVYYGSMAALRVMLPQGGGCILTTTSGAGFGAVPGLAVYGCAKAAVNSLMRSIAIEYGKQGVRAVAISPGAMDTPGLRSWIETLPGGAKAYNDAQPSGRLGLPEEIADAAVYLASDYASFINGSALPVDGAVQAMLALPGQVNQT